MRNMLILSYFLDFFSVPTSKTTNGMMSHPRLSVALRPGSAAILVAATLS
jgi:hypothetical protein